MAKESNIEIRNARLQLFINFAISPKLAKRFLDDMSKNPNKIAQYYQLLSQNLSNQFDEIKEKTKGELKNMVKIRVQEWQETIGHVSMQEFVSMSNHWEISIDDIIDERITPELIKEMLDFFIVGQDNYKVKLSIAFFTYLMRKDSKTPNLPKSNLLVCGPSGSGKTYGMQVLSKLFQVPFITVHCNSVVQEGIVGTSLTDGFTSSLINGWKKEQIEHAVVCFDEFDKLFERPHSGKSTGVYNERIVNEMLNIIDDKGEVEFKTTFDSRESDRIKISNRKMMFVFTGVFEGIGKQLEEIRQDDLTSRKKIGFRNREEQQQQLESNQDTILIKKQLNENDFIAFGVKPEIVGRIQNFVNLEPLNEEEMMRLFDLGPYSPFTEFEQYFAFNNIDTVLTEEGKHTLAKLACERNLGVRGLKGLLQRVLTEDMYDLEVGEDNILKITKQYIMDNLRK
ncbi:MAG: AAA family ATPase [Candidatus Limimorpha sp.]